MRSPRRTPRTPWHLPQFTTKNPRATKQQTTQFPWRRPQSIPDRARRIPCTCLYFWSIERVRHLPNVVCYTPTATPACIDNILDWFLTILGILLLRMFFNFLSLSFHTSSTTPFLFNHQGATIGRLFDTHGPTWLMIAGTICCFISTLTTSLCEEYYQYILSQGILFGLGVGLLYVSFLDDSLILHRYNRLPIF